ncbi:porin [Alteromonas sp. a30]|uniref:porin n=1 Tax=Alteromonas sp. a30 TaxID=2730917 RepID=UPI0022809BA9|nr:porin [Alteromonas sp. a30]MCY7294785.1 porin [Alteromonas sp. a30]
MEKRIIALVLLGLSASTSVQAASSPGNLVERPITLADGETSLSLGAVYGEKQNGVHNWGADIQLGYGITEHLTLDFSGLRYRFMQRPENGTGLELTAGLGVRGELESEQFGDSHAYGIDITGKYVFSSDMAAVFNVGYIRWNEDHRENKSEFDFSLGIQKRLFEGVTLSASYTYRDLQDFAQDDAYVWNIGATYNIRKDVDISVSYGQTNFDYARNGYDADEHFRKGLGVYFTYRF